MKRGFFTSASTKVAPPSRIPKCGACKLHKQCESPKLPVYGEGKRRILIITDCPTLNDDEEGEWLSGQTGVYLKKAFRRNNMDLRRDCWVTGSIICKPKGNDPTPDQIDYCRPNITMTLDRLKPYAILCLGHSAVRSVVGPLWKEAPGPIEKWHGWAIPCQKINTWIFPCFHPIECIKDEKNRELRDMMVDQVLSNLEEIDNYPWRKKPKEKEAVEIIYDDRKVAHIIDKMINKGGPLAFDYETNRLKPDYDGREIVSCSICWRGRKTIAYPMKGKAIDATYRMLRSKNPKIASNLKFEERWSLSVFDTAVRNWYWDTMIASHVHDNRKGITSIKFQAFVLLGSDNWSQHVEGNLRAEDEAGFNKIHDIPMDDLLLYNGLDSLLEYRVAKKQIFAINYRKAKGL